jgi:hypothetical protein
MMTQKTRETKNRLQLTDQQQKRESGEFRDKGETIQAFSSHNSALSSINIGAPGVVGASMWMAETQQSVWGIHGFRGELKEAALQA